jgi:hypothetical protein
MFLREVSRIPGEQEHYGERSDPAGPSNRPEGRDILPPRKVDLPPWRVRRLVCFKIVAAIAPQRPRRIGKTTGRAIHSSKDSALGVARPLATLPRRPQKTVGWPASTGRDMLSVSP